MTLAAGGYEIDIIVTGFPGKSVCHGPLGWSTVALVRGHGKIALIDVGSFGLRSVILEGLKSRGLSPGDVTDVLLTHSHYDHSVNWVSFPNARIAIGTDELDWALEQPFGQTIVPELYIRELGRAPALHRIAGGEEVIPGITAIDAPGHTPGHLVFRLEGESIDVFFTGDAVKNRAELVSGAADMTYDPSVSRATIEHIRAKWGRKPGSVLVPGHDLPMTLENGEATYVGEHNASIRVWDGLDLETTTTICLSCT